MTKYFSTPKGEIIIRTARPEDAASIFNLRLEALKTHPEAFAADVDMTNAKGLEAWAEQIDRETRDETGVLVIAMAGMDVIGMTGIGRGHWPKTRHSAIVWGVYVNPEWRGLRIAEALLDECIDWSRAHNIVVLRLGVVTTNAPALRCYQRSGFTIYGTEPKSNYVNGIYYDEYLMSRLI